MNGKKIQPDAVVEVNDGRPATSAMPVWTSQQLFSGNREILIEHEGETYRLRQTRNGRLILQK